MPLIRKPPGSPPSPPADGAGVLTALEKGSDEERWTAARAAAGLPGGAQALGEALLRERNPRVREAMFTGLARLGTSAAVERLIPLLRSDDAGLRTGAMDALRAMPGAAVGPHAAQLLRDSDSDVRVLACELLRNLPAEEASRLLCALLEAEPEANVCAAAVEVLGEAGGEEALPVLARCGERFRGNAFLEFAIKLTTDRIREASDGQRA